MLLRGTYDGRADTINESLLWRGTAIVFVSVRACVRSQRLDRQRLLHRKLSGSMCPTQVKSSREKSVEEGVLGQLSFSLSN